MILLIKYSLRSAPHLICRKHAPPGLGDDHLGAQLVELLPQRFHLKLHLQIRNIGLVRKRVFDATLTKAASTGGHITNTPPQNIFKDKNLGCLGF